MLYTSIDYDQNEVMKGVKSVMGDVPIIGCTSSGWIIVSDGVITSKNGFSEMLVLDDEDLVIGVAGRNLKEMLEKLAYSCNGSTI